MKKILHLGLHNAGTSMLVFVFLMLQQINLSAQSNLNQYVVFGGWSSLSGTNSVDISGAAFTGGGHIGSAQNIRTTGSLNLTGSVFSTGKILLSNNNIITGRVTAASGTNPVLQTGTGLNIGGNVDINGDIIIGGGVIGGTITQPVGSTISPTTFSSTKSTPNLPDLPSMPAITTFPEIPATAANITGTRILTPMSSTPGSGIYKDMILTGSRTITFSGVGVYVLNSINNSGNANTFVFDFKNAPTGSIKIYIKGNVNLFKSKIQIVNGGGANRIYTEVQGTGATYSSGYAWRHDNGTSGTNNSQWAGTVWAPNGDIFIGSGPQNSIYTGALWSGKRVVLGGSFNMAFVPWIGEVVVPVKSDLSDIIVKSGYVYTESIPYVNYQATDITLNGTDNIELVKFSVRDGGLNGDPDNFTTSLNTLALNITNSANIKRIAIYDDAGNELGETDGAPTVTFNGLNIIAGDNGLKDFSIRASFNTSATTQNQSIILTVANGTAADPAGSGFIPNAGGVSTSATNNKILVIIPDYAFPPGGKTQKVVVSPELSSICDFPTLKANIIAAGAPSQPEYVDPLTGSIISTNTLKDTYVVEGDGLTENGTSIYIEVVALASTDLTSLKGYLVTNYQMDGFINNLTNSLKITGKVTLPKLCLLINDQNIISKSDDIIPLYPAAKNLEFSVLNKGFANSNGDTAMGTNKLREGYGLSGDGIKIGILSDSYNKNASVRTAEQDIASNDLPQAGVTLVEGTEVYNFKGTDEGRAMAQIIYDVAPKASLYFRTGFRNADDFALGIQQLKDNDCKIIVDDITYFTQPFFRDGVVAQMVNKVAGEGVAYFSAAGNFGNKAYDGVFKPVNAPNSVTSQPNGSTAKAHNFSNAGTDEYQKIRLKKGSYTLVLQWDDDVYSMGGVGNTGAKKDLDIYLTDESGNIEFGFNKNNSGRDPVEVMPFTVLEDDAVTNIMITDALGTATGTRFKYVVFRGRTGFTFVDEQYSGTYASTLVGHPNASGAITVGAVRRRLDGSVVIENFSSPGGTAVTSSSDTRNKPDISAPNGGNNTFLGTKVKFADFDSDELPNFFGTSAAAPHAAAAAALLLEAKAKFSGVTLTSNGALTPETVRQLFKDYTQQVSAFVALENGQNAALSAGSGLIQPEAILQTFANAKPKIVSDGISIINLNDGTYKVIVTGQYLDPLTTLKIGEREYTSEEVTVEGTTVFVIREPIVGDPEFRLYTPPQSTLDEPLDGGFSDPVKLSDSKNRQTVTVRTLPATKKFGEVLPNFEAEITVTRLSETEPNTIVTVGTYHYPFTETNTPPAELGLDNLAITSLANNLSPVGTYPIKPILPANTNTVIYTSVEDASLTINPMPIKIVAFQKKDPLAPLVYGQPIRGIQFLYIMDESKLGDDVQKAAFRKAVMLRHQLPINPKAYALIKDRSIAKKNGIDAVLTPADLSNMAAMVSENSISEAEGIINSEAEAIINSELEAIINSEAEAIINDAELEAIINSETEAIINSEDLLVNYAVGKDTIPNILVNVSVKNLFAYQDAPNVATLSSESEAIINALSIVETEAIINSESEAIINSELEAIINSEAEAIINQEPVGEGNVILNGVFLDVNAIANDAELEAIINAEVLESEAIINDAEVEAIINDAEVEAIINTEGIINSETEAIINSEAEAIINSTGAESEAIVNSFNNLGSSALNSKTVNDSSNANVMIAFNNEYPAGSTSIKLRPVTMITGVEAGKHYVIPPAFFSENFVVTYGVGDFEIEKAKLDVEVTSTASAITYGAPLPKVGLKFDISSKWYKNALPTDVFESLKIKLYNGDAAVTGLPGASTTPYSIKPVITLKDNMVLGKNFGSNYELGTITNTELTVNPAALTVTVVDTSRVYGAVNPVYRLIYSGLLNDETLANAVTSAPVANTTAIQSSPVDADPLTEGIQTYPITLSGGTSANYTFNFVPGNLTITPATLTATAQPKSREYFTDNPAFTIAYSGFVVTGENESSAITTAPAAATTALKESNAGEYPITLSGGTAPNYVFNLVNGLLTVTKVQLTVKADDKQWYDNQSAPVDDGSGTFFSRTVTGFRNNDTEASVVLGTTSYSVPSYQAKTGTYAIVPAGTSLPAVTNYFIKHDNGTLYVNDDKAKKITTALKCVEQLSTPINGFSYRATFTYDNPNTTDVFVPLGEKNFLEGASYDQSTPPPTLFKRTDGEYKLLFNGTVRWVLVTNSLNTNTQSTSAPRAKESSPRCTIGGAVASGGTLQLNNLPVDQALTMTENKYSVYPNPVSNRLTVTSALQSLKPTDISVYDLQGKLYRVTTTRQVSSNKVELDISPLANGVYMIRVNTGAENKVFRVVKQ